MESRQRMILAAIWFGVAVVIASSVDPAALGETDTLLQVFVIALAVTLSITYLLDPWGLVSRYHG